MKPMGKAACLVALVMVQAIRVCGAPTINGSVDTGSEGWMILTEQNYAAPFGGGSASESDRIAETAVYHWWDGSSDRFFSSDNRGDIINVYATWDANALYLAVAGPTVPFNSWGEGGTGGNNDQGDLFIAIDTNALGASGSLTATNGHASFGGVKAVDFLGWTPSYVVGVQYVDNGGGGGGYANFEQTATHSVLAGEGQNLNNGGFDWMAAVNGSAAYDAGAHGGNGFAGEFEFRIPWTLLGFSSAPTQSIRFAAYTTQNFDRSDVYDSGPGTGQLVLHEEIGDAPGDPGPGYNVNGVIGTLAAGDGLGDDTGDGDDGAINGSFPGADRDGGDLTAAPNHGDGLDTIGEYLSLQIPEPGTLALLAIGLAGLAIRRRAAR